MKNSGITRHPDNMTDGNRGKPDMWGIRSYPEIRQNMIFAKAGHLRNSGLPRNSAKPDSQSPAEIPNVRPRFRMLEASNAGKCNPP